MPLIVPTGKVLTYSRNVRRGLEMMRRSPWNVGRETILLPFSTGSFENASTRYFRDGVTPQVLWPFSANVLAKGIISGVEYGQFEAEATNLQPRAQQLEVQAVWTRVAMGVDANDADDPSGNLTAEKLTPTSGAPTTHYIVSTSASIVNGTIYTFHVFGNAGGYDWILLHAFTGFPANSFAYFDVANGVVGTVGSGNPNPRIFLFNDGWFLASITATAAATGATALVMYVAVDDNTPTFSGDGSSHVHGWNVQLEASPFPSSMIPTIDASATRNKDKFHYSYADVPPVIWGAPGKWLARVIPHFSSSEITSDHMICGPANVANAGLKFDGTQKKFVLTAGGVEKRASNVVSFDRITPMIIINDNRANSIEVSGAGSGNGKVPGLAYDWDTSVDLLWGSHNAYDLQWGGKISEPRGLG